MLSDKSKTIVEFSAGVDGRAVPVARASGNKKATAFEARVDQLTRGGNGEKAMTAVDALCFAVEEDSARYETHLQAKGAFAQQL